MRQTCYVIGLLLFIIPAHAQHEWPADEFTARFAYPNKSGGRVHLRTWDPQSAGDKNLLFGSAHYCRGTNQIGLSALQQKHISDATTEIGVHYIKIIPFSKRSQLTYAFLGTELRYLSYQGNSLGLARVNVMNENTLPFQYYAFSASFIGGYVYRSAFRSHFVVQDLYMYSPGEIPEAFGNMRVYGLLGYHFRIQRNWRITPWVSYEWLGNQQRLHPGNTGIKLEVLWKSYGWNFAVMPVYYPEYKMGLQLGISPAHGKFTVQFGLYSYQYSPYQESQATVGYLIQ